MAEEVLRLGVDPRGGVRGMQQFSAATTKAVGTAWSMNAVLGTMAASFGALAAGRAIGAGIRGMMDFDQAMTQSLAIQGEMAQSMRGEMAAAARQVGQELNFAATEGAEAFFFLASAGLDAEQQLAALPAVAEFARAGMFDFATATDLATDAQSALGLASQDAQKNLQNMTRVTDVLVKANTLANATVEQFASALTTESGAALKSFNIDVEEGVAVLAAFADQGVKGQTAGSGLSRILRLMSSAAVNNKEEMAALGLEIFDSQGNMRNMADVVESLENALGGMSDAQRVAALESIGFQARVQGVLLPLLGTSDAIREYEAGLRDAGGTTRDVAEGQMQSLENRIGAIRRQFENWRDEMAARTIPAIEWAIENVDTLTDAIIGLSIAIGTLMAFKVGAWAVAAAAAFGGWITVVGSLALGVKSLSAALALLQVAIGPVGWVVLGVSAITAAVMGWRRVTRDAADEQDALRDSTRSLTERLDEQTDAFKRLTDAQLQSQIAQREARAEQIRGQMQELEGQLAVGAPSGTMENLDRHREALAAEEEAIKRINGILLDRHAIEGVTTQTVREREQAQRDAVNGLREHIALLTDALDLDVQTHAALETALDLRDGIRSEIDGGVDSLERLVGLLKDEQALNRSISGHLDRRVGLQRELLTLASGMPQQIQAQEAASRGVEASASAVANQYSRIRAQADEFADSSINVAQIFEDNWQTAISVVGASLGGLAGQVANIVSAFATGGLSGGLAAAGGFVVNKLFGGGREEAEEQRRMAEEIRRTTEALTTFADRLRGVSEIEGLRGDATDLLFDALDAATEGDVKFTRQMTEAVKEWAKAIGAGQTDMDALRDWILTFADDTGAAVEALELFVDAARAIEERRQADIASIEDRLQIRQLDASGDTEGAEELRRQKELEKELAEARALESNALVVLVQETWAMEQAAREAADATAALRSARDEELSLQHREAMLRGDERGALHARLQRQAEAELNALQDRLDAGKISEEHFLRVADIIRGEVNQALAEMAQAAREAAEAERMRQAMDTENLRVRLLRLQGLHVEAAQLEANIALQNALNEGRGGEYLAILQQINALQIQEAAQRNVTSATQEMNRTLQDTTRMLNAPSGISNALIRHRAFQGLEGAGPAPVNRVQQSTQSQTVHMTFGDLSFPNVTEPTDVKRMLRELLTEGQKQARAGSGNVFISGMD